MRAWTTAGEALGLTGAVMTAGATGEGRPTGPEAPTATDGSRGNAYLVGGGTNPHSPGQHQERTHRDPKHPPVTEAAPSPSTRSGGDGHSAPPVWLESRRGREGGSSVPSINRGDAKVLERPFAPVSATEAKGASAIPEKRNRASDDLCLATGRRRLTVTECRVLMGWPPEYDEHLATVTKTNGYRILGNGCVPRWVEVHARAVVEADR